MDIPLKRSLKILYEDPYYIAVDKPPGLLVVPTPRKEKHTLVALLNRAGRQPGHCAVVKIFPCHRLDRDTSGVILFAKGKKFQQMMMEQFRRGDVKKKYIAFAQGKLPQKAGEIKSHIQDLEERRYHRHAPARWACTRYRVLAVHRRFTVVEVTPLTGRTNQIRIHFRQIGHPLVGERKYAFARDFELKFRRAALHAARLEWWHPVRRKIVAVEAPMASDMEKFLRQN